MEQVKIYKPVKTAMQSGLAKTHRWVMEFSQRPHDYVDPLMHWTGSKNTSDQVRLQFLSLDQAIAYAKSQGWTYSVRAPHRSQMRPKSYADNFRA